MFYIRIFVKSFAGKLPLLLFLDAGLALLSIGHCLLYLLVKDSISLLFFTTFIKSIVVPGTVNNGHLSDLSIIFNAIVGYGFISFTFSIVLLGFQDFFRELRIERIR